MVKNHLNMQHLFYGMNYLKILDYKPIFYILGI